MNLTSIHLNMHLIHYTFHSVHRAHPFTQGQLRNLRMPSTATNTDDLVRFGRTEIFDINLPGRANTTLDFDLPMAFRLQVSDEMTLRRERIVAQPSRAAVRHLARKVTNVAKNGGSNGVAARIASSDAEYAASTELMSALNGTGMLHAHNLHNCMDDASQNATATDTVNKMNYTPLTLSTRQWSRWLLIHQLRNANQCLFINSADITGNSGPLRPMPVQEAARLGTSVLGFRATVHVSGFLDAIGYMPIVTGQLLSYCPTSDHAVDA